MAQHLLYHITSVRNLSGILEAGGLLPNKRLEAGTFTDVAHGHIQQRRARKLIPCGPRGTLHDYVPFFLCNRPPMLFLLNKQGRQRDMIYIVTSIEKITANSQNFVFSDGHATMRLSKFYDDPKDLEKVDWPLMEETYWDDTIEDSDRRRRRQAEFLVHDFVPLSSLLGLAVQHRRMERNVKQILNDFDLELYLKVKPKWYY